MLASKMSVYQQVPTLATPRARPQAPAQPVMPDGQPVELPPLDDKWKLVEFFAKRAEVCVSVEQDLRNAFDKRQTIARRLTDSARRKDDTLATDSARAWIESEVRLVALIDKYKPMIAEREATVMALGARPGG